ncbi:MAG TPA: tRNA pseudouridine(55) synthase TruB [Phycisphaerae bacterium]|nr:tRNA pseudouridine(55) synthase TruB [Phycisphaerae bacterium]
MSKVDLPVRAGILNLYKPAWKTSAQYVYRLRPLFGIRKVGHAGTLDPFADGVLIACLGSGTKLVGRLMALPKCYLTTLRLGVTNECFDMEKPCYPVPGAVSLPDATVEEAVARLARQTEQVPPAFSAARVGGIYSYHLARSGRDIPHQAKSVRIDHIRVIEYRWPTLRLDIQCGRGTYIRAMARDLGQILGCGAVCETLTRAAVGPFRVEDSVRLDSASPEQVREALIPVDEARALFADPGPRSQP